MLSQPEVDDLRCLVGLMIPASAEYGVPGADDATVFASILDSLGRDLANVRAALRDLAARAGGGFAGLPTARQVEIAAALHASGGESIAVLQRLVLLCYYRDDRVMRSLDLEPRAPFPRGHTLEQGDWSLLDPVRSRPKLWRDPAAKPNEEDP